MRQTFDDMWIVDLEGDNLGARKTENVFAIQTPVAIAIGVRYGQPKPETPAKVHYTRIDGTEKEKLAKLANITSFHSLEWRDCPIEWTDLFLPIGDSDYGKWAKLTDLFPWQVGGSQFKRTWTIGESVEVLQSRWKTLVSTSDQSLRKTLYKETRDRKISKSYRSLEDNELLLTPVSSLSLTSQTIEPIRYAYRSFDRQWALLDNRLCDYPRPSLIHAHSDQQIYMTSLLTEVLGQGVSAVVTALVPDLHHFRGSFGGKHVIPLWRDKTGSEANITNGVLEVLNTTIKREVSSEDFFAYCYTLLATPRYVKEFWNELETPSPRIPITKDADLFVRLVAIGRKLIWLHTYGERFVPSGKKAGKIPTGKARCKIGTPTTEKEYPDQFAYDVGNQELKVGGGVFSNVRQEVWEFSISCLDVVKSWLAYRMKSGAGKKSSPLDDIRPQTWQFDNELLDLLWVLDATIDLYPELSNLFDEVIQSQLFLASDFPKPTDIERSAASNVQGQLPLLELEEEIEEED